MQFIFTSFETSASEFESPTDSVSSLLSHLSLLEHVQEMLALRDCPVLWLSAGPDQVLIKQLRFSDM